jgi:hypothetical protein
MMFLAKNLLFKQLFPVKKALIVVTRILGNRDNEEGKAVSGSAYP